LLQHHGSSKKLQLSKVWSVTITLNYKTPIFEATWLRAPTVFNRASKIAQRSEAFIGGIVSRKRYQSVTPIVGGQEKPSRRC
jgi:hypothetical protein